VLAQVLDRGGLRRLAGVVSASLRDQRLRARIHRLISDRAASLSRVSGCALANLGESIDWSGALPGDDGSLDRAPSEAPTGAELQRPQRVGDVRARGTDRRRRPPSAPMISAKPGQPSRSGVTRNANARCEKVCQFMVAVVRPFTGSTARQPTARPSNAMISPRRRTRARSAPPPSRSRAARLFPEPARRRLSTWC